MASGEGSIRQLSGRVNAAMLPWVRRKDGPMDGLGRREHEVQKGAWGQSARSRGVGDRPPRICVVEVMRLDGSGAN